MIPRISGGTHFILQRNYTSDITESSTRGAFDGGPMACVAFLLFKPLSNVKRVETKKFMA